MQATCRFYMGYWDFGLDIGEAPGFSGAWRKGEIYTMNRTCYTYTCELRDEGDVKSFEMLR